MYSRTYQLLCVHPWPGTALNKVLDSPVYPWPGTALNKVLDSPVYPWPGTTLNEVLDSPYLRGGFCSHLYVAGTVSLVINRCVLFQVSSF